MEYLYLHLAFEKREFPGGLEEFVQGDLLKCPPPSWAAGIRLVPADEADAVLLVLSGDPSDTMRRVFHQSFRRAVPIAAMSIGEPASGDGLLLRLKSWGTWWTFRTTAEARQLAAGPVASWLGGVARGGSPHPSGEDLLAGYGSIDRTLIDAGALERASEVFRRRGFVCLSGSQGSGKTTLARHLLSMSADEGLNPVEVISGDLDTRAVDAILTGPEDCAVFIDLDNLRRFCDIWSAFIWDIALSLMIRVTERRRRLVLASSSPRLDVIFSSYGEAHVTLPDPAGRRDWRLSQGRTAYDSLVSTDPLKAAEHVLMSMFEPAVPEELFRDSLTALWERLHVIHRKRFPSAGELEALYAESDAAAGRPPFRRVRIEGEVHLAAGDATIMSSIDEAVAVMCRRGDPVIHSLGEVLLSSPEPRARRAGFGLAFSYGLLSDDEKATLLHSCAVETDPGTVVDTLSVLLRSPELADEGVYSLCEFLAASGDPLKRQNVAQVCAMPWTRADARLSRVVGALADDPDPDVRAALMRGISLWGTADDPGGVYSRLVRDAAESVRGQVVGFIGTRFPRITHEETGTLNEVLEGGNPRLHARLAWGLLNRAPEQFNREFTDLLWVLLGKLGPGGRGMVARQIGGRLRYFDMEVRRALLSDLEEQDQGSIIQCLLMNYSWLTTDEADKLWRLATDRITGSIAFASLILRYFRVFEPARRVDLVDSVLRSEEYQGREALSQLIARYRWDLAEVALESCARIIASGTDEERSRQCWFLLWNMDVYGEEGRFLLERLLGDGSALVRTALARAVLRQGTDGPVAEWLLRELSADAERSIRAVAGEALGRLSGTLAPGSVAALERLLADSDASVRARTLRGVIDSVHAPVEERIRRLADAARDSSANVRREIVAGLSDNPACLAHPGCAPLVAGLLEDPDEKTRLDAAKLVTSSPALISSEAVRRRLPDLLMNRGSGGASIIEELSTAREIQKELLPDRPPRLENYEIEFFYSPAREIGGDYFDFFGLPEDNLGLAVGDVTGKGIPAALTMAGLKGNLNAQVQNIYSIDEIMRRVNEAVCAGAEGSSLAGLFYGVLDIRGGLFTYVNAGHNPPVFVKRGGETKLLTEGGLLLGAVPGAAYEHGFIRFDPADVLVMYTDGITESMDDNGTEFGLTGLVSTVLSSRDLPGRQIISRILEAVARHSGGQPRVDDQTLVVVKRR